MTAWPTHVRGHRTLWSLLHDWEPNMLKYFKQAGYDVRWWGKNDLLAPDAFNRSVTSALSKGNELPLITHHARPPARTPVRPHAHLTSTST